MVRSRYRSRGSIRLLVLGMGLAVRTRRGSGTGLPVGIFRRSIPLVDRSVVEDNNAQCSMNHRVGWLRPFP